MEDLIPGFVWGYVTNRDDPDHTGRVKAMIPGVAEPEWHNWIMPFGWDAGGAIEEGSQPKAPPLKAQIAILFEGGEYRSSEARAIFLRGYYGLGPDKVSAGPDCVSTAAKPEDVHCIWEDENFQAYVTNDEENETKKFTIQTRAGSKIELDAYAGEDGGSEVITMEARTAISIYSEGQVDIAAGGLVTIQDRVVGEGGGEI